MKWIILAPKADDDDTLILRTARTPHRCHVLKRDGRVVRSWDGGDLPPGHGDIQRGERYIEYVGEAPAYQSGKRYCPACCVAAGLARWVDWPNVTEHGVEPTLAMPVQATEDP